jgi:nucleosome binding factor SPN SPT16 subunit
MLKVFEGITALKKTATKREAEKKELADVIEQEKLIELKGSHRAHLTAAKLNVIRSTPLHAETGVSKTCP